MGVIRGRGVLIALIYADSDAIQVAAKGCYALSADKKKAGEDPAETKYGDC
jgi:hypothetical protein